LHAVEQAWHPMQSVWSSTFPQRTGRLASGSGAALTIAGMLTAIGSAHTKSRGCRMRLITRSDFDGLACAVLLKEVESIDAVEFVHPKDVQAGTVRVGPNDILTNLPYHPDCGMWFDHHASEAQRGPLEKIRFKGRFAVAPSAARVVYDHYVEAGLGKELKRYKKLLEVVDKSDAAQLTKRDVTSPRGWMLLSYVMDPRTGLGYQHDYAISNKQLMAKMIDWIPRHSADEILKKRDVAARVKTYRKDQDSFKKVLQERSRQEKNVVITDLRGIATPAGNRFLIYTLFPTANVSVRIFDAKGGELSVIAVGHNVFNRTAKADCGKLTAAHGGGGHRGAGAAQVPKAAADAALKQIVAALKRAG
jgi:hypothetical protein